MINATMFDFATRKEIPTLVNPNLVTHVFEKEITFRAKGDLPEQTLTLTLIAFCVGMHEDVDSIFVTEPLSELRKFM